MGTEEKEIRKKLIWLIVVALVILAGLCAMAVNL
jgi:hypothetical protein